MSSLKTSDATRKKILQVRAKIELETGVKTTFEKAVAKACDFFIDNWKEN